MYINVKIEPLEPGTETTDTQALPSFLNNNLPDFPTLNQSEDAPAECDLECPTPPAKKIKKSAIEQLLGDVHIVSATPGKTIAQRVKSELENFKKQSSIPLNANPLLWWKTNESHPSLLARLAKNLLGIHQPVCQVKDQSCYDLNMENGAILNTKPTTKSELETNDSDNFFGVNLRILWCFLVFVILPVAFAVSFILYKKHCDHSQVLDATIKNDHKTTTDVLSEKINSFFGRGKYYDRDINVL
nr:uncharacterized protein LOC117686085 [Crassostrea gigas]